MELRIKATNVFETIYNSTKKIVVARGGTRAGKTYAIIQMLALWLLTGILRGKNTDATIASVVRKTLPSLKATAMRDLIEILTNWGVFHLVNHNKTDNIFSFGGRMIEFFSVDDQQKVRGRKRHILFANEANELDFENDFFQLLIRTELFLIFDLNPSDPYTWIKTELEDIRANSVGDVDTFVFTHLDNGFLSAEQHREIEGIRDPVLRQVYVYGQYGLVKGLVFPNITVVEAFPDDCKRSGFGLDFGFTNSPSALIHCGIKGDRLYLHEVFYEYAMNNDIIAEKTPRNKDVYADPAEPKSIDELKRKGLRILPASKGQGSVNYGIDLMKQYEICITATSSNLLREQKLYKYKKDSNGNFINEPEKGQDHCWDAARYWAQTALAKPEKGILGTF